MSNIYNIAANSIKVFPLSKNRTNDRSARLFYENNVANLIRQLIDVEGFLISDANSVQLRLGTPVSNTSNNTVTYPLLLNNDLVFNLYGYYFSITKDATLFEITIDATSTDTVSYKVVAALKIDSTSNEIYGFDNAGKYEGLSIFTVNNMSQIDSSYHFIELCDFEMTYDSANSRWVVTSTVCSSSYQKIGVKSLDMSISRIDGKH